MSDRNNAFWHPVMGAVDTMTQDILRRRQRAADIANQERVMATQQQNAAALQTQRHKNDQELQQQRNSAEAHKLRMANLFDLSRAPDIDSKTRDLAMSNAIKMATDPKYVPDSDISAAPMTRPLRPDVAKHFGGLRDADNLPFAVAEKLEKQFDEYRTRVSMEKKNEAMADKYRADAKRETKKTGETKKPDDKKRTQLDYVRHLKKEAEDHYRLNQESMDLDEYQKYMEEVNDLERKAINGTITDEEIAGAKSLPKKMRRDKEKTAKEEQIMQSMEELKKSFAKMRGK